MQQPLITRRFLYTLLTSAILFPICICVTLGVAFLLEGMGDITGGVVLRRIALAGSVIWIIDLICLLLVLAVGTLRGQDDSDEK